MAGKHLTGDLSVTRLIGAHQAKSSKSKEEQKGAYAQNDDQLENKDSGIYVVFWHECSVMSD